LLLYGALDGIATDGEAGADKWARLLSFDDRARRQRGHAMGRLELLDCKELGQQSAIRQIGAVGDVHTRLELAIYYVCGSIDACGRIFELNVVRALVGGSEQLAPPVRPRHRPPAACNLIARTVGCIDSCPPGYIERCQLMSRKHEPVPFDREGLDPHGRVFEFGFA